MGKTDLLAPGTIVGGFRIVRKIDEGGMGEVYEAYDDGLNRRIAVKILLASQLGAGEALARFKAEGRALGQLNHPNVVKLHILGQQEDMNFMAMEYIDGQNLDKHLMEYSCGLMDTLDLFRQMVEGLAAAHELDIVHRDIKPQNIMVDKTGRAKIVDFGIAKVQTEVDNFKTSTGIVLGTRSFLAPEILRGLPATKQADIYSLGLILKFLLTGDMPQVSPNTDGVGNTARQNLLYPRALQNLIQGMTQPNKEMRYHSLMEVLRDLKQITFLDFHPDLLASSSKGQRVQDLAKIYEQCRQRGLDMMESRMAVALASQLEGKNPVKVKTAPISLTTEKIDLNEVPMFSMSEEMLTST